MTDKFDAKASELQAAVTTHNTDAALRLLESAGGACEARDLAKRASNLPELNWFSVNWSLNVNRREHLETLSLYKVHNNYAGNDEPVVSLTQERCDK
ncbi:MAG TPA: hypothetical protein V6C81_28930 [Planktothrix sp.]